MDLDATTSPATQPAAHRLPGTATPHRYDLRLAPDLGTATFTGSVAIALTVSEATRTLVCNAAELDVTAAWVDAAGTRLEATTSLDETLEQLTVETTSTLDPGEAVLHLEFSGVLNDKLRGFYRSTFTDDEGATRSVAVTQFEPTDARRAFPCWDEPSAKAVFGVTLDVAEDLLAISNGPEISRSPLGDGRVRVEFADTMPMSTYLVAFVIGPLHTTAPVDVDGVPLRIVFRPGQDDLAAFALEAGAFALRFFADYYGIVYPGDKVDMVAVPDFAFGAMENLGCIIYRESLLLIDPDTATQNELLAVADVISHELAHMWFGDLVTMRWWNGIWLNEAFATFMEMTCSAAFRPAWRRWMHFGRERSLAFDIDALGTTRPIEYEVVTPADAEGMFDTLTYQKGSAVVRMLEQYLGADAFRDGIRRYLQTHQFGNTETGDLWDALEAETGEPVRAMMDSWIFQGGFPLIEARRDGDALHVRQQRFTYDSVAAEGGEALGAGGGNAGGGDGEAIWHVPLVVGDGSVSTRLVLDRAEATIDCAGMQPAVVNAGGHGFYRVAYDAPSRTAVLDGLGALAPLERYAVLDDTVALVLRGDLAGADLAGVIARMASAGEDDLSIWQLGNVAIDILHRAAGPDGRATFSSWVRPVMAPVWRQLGPDVQPGDDDRRRALRGLVLGILGTHGDPEAVELATTLFDRSVAAPGSVDAELAAGALRTVAVVADKDRFEAMIERFRSGATPQEQFRFLYAAADVDDPALFEQYLDLLGTDEIRSQNLAFTYRAALRNLRHGPHVWDTIETRWDDIRERLPFNSTHRMVEGITAIADPDVARRIADFLADHEVPEATKLIAQHTERMWVQVELHRREAGRLASSLP